MRMTPAGGSATLSKLAAHSLLGQNGVLFIQNLVTLPLSDSFLKKSYAAGSYCRRDYQDICSA
jgi:hypothetical protein